MVGKVEMNISSNVTTVSPLQKAVPRVISTFTQEINDDDYKFARSRKAPSIDSYGGTRNKWAEDIVSAGITKGTRHLARSQSALAQAVGITCGFVYACPMTAFLLCGGGFLTGAVAVGCIALQAATGKVSLRQRSEKGVRIVLFMTALQQIEKRVGELALRAARHEMSSQEQGEFRQDLQDCIKELDRLSLVVAKLPSKSKRYSFELKQPIGATRQVVIEALSMV